MLASQMIFIRNNTLGFSVNLSFLFVSSKSLVFPLCQMLNHPHTSVGDSSVANQKVTQVSSAWEGNEIKKVVRTSKTLMFQVSILFIL